MPENKIMLLFLDGSNVKFNKPPNFDLQLFVHGCRSIGMVLTTGFYVPFNLVKAVLDMDAADAVYDTQGVPQPTAQGTDTKQ